MQSTSSSYKQGFQVNKRSPHHNSESQNIHTFVIPDYEKIEHDLKAFHESKPTKGLHNSILFEPTGNYGKRLFSGLSESENRTSVGISPVFVSPLSISPLAGMIDRTLQEVDKQRRVLGRRLLSVTLGK